MVCVWSCCCSTCCDWLFLILAVSSIFLFVVFFFFFSSRRRHTRWTGDWSSDVCSSDLLTIATQFTSGKPMDGSAAGYSRRSIPDRLSSRRCDLAQFLHFPRSTLSLKTRSEERRVGKECRSRWSRYH